MAVGMHVAMVMGVAVEIGRNHQKVLYYNITAVYKRKRGSLNGGDGRCGERRE
jgi:hypothetical protein